jgi:hypothetical protein
MMRSTTPPTAVAQVLRPGGTAVGGTAVGGTAVGRTAVGRTAVGRTAVGRTAVGRTAGQGSDTLPRRRMCCRPR